MTNYFKYQLPTEIKDPKKLSINRLILRGVNYKWHNKRLDDFEYTDLALLFDHNAKLYTNQIAFQKYDEKNNLRKLTFSQWRSQARKLASQLQNIGIKPGDHVAILLDNGPEWVTAVFALFIAGITVIPLSMMLKTEELEFILKQSDTHSIISQVNFIERLASVNLPLDLIVYPVTNGLRHVPPEMSSKFESITVLDPNRGGEPLPVDYSNPERLALIMYTSGTMSDSKGVMLTHRAIIYDIKVALQGLPFERLPIVVSVSFLPLTHILEFTAGLCCLNSMGALVHYVHGYASKIIKQLLFEVQPTILIGVPLIYRHLMKSIQGTIAKLPKLVQMMLINPITGKYNLFGRSLIRNSLGGRLMVLITGGAAIEMEVLEFYNSLKIYPLQGYGLTETSPVVTLSPLVGNRLGTVGILLEGVEIKLENTDETGIGEILLKGPMLFNGYYKNPEATSAAFTDDGWFRSGDLGMVDADGFATFKGRLKNLIVTPGGKNVYPEEIEDRLNSSPLFKETAAFGYPFQQQGEMELAVIIVPDLDAIKEFLNVSQFEELTEQQIHQVVQTEMDTILSKISSYKHPKMWRILNGELPRTSTKKTIARKCIILFTQLLNR